uniref:Uncharacterized protein n=1 Tax=Cacopsylla melanoneura TaxID=428564 RepID=A0A8D8RHA7_9HEMI
MKFNNYLGRVVNTLGVKAARNMKSKHCNMVSIKDLASTLKAFNNKSELNQFTSSVNHLIKTGIVNLVLPECVRKSLNKVGLGKLMGKQLLGSHSHSSLPHLSSGVVYNANGLPLSKLCGCSSCCSPCASSCGDCRPRLSIGVVYPNVTNLF